MNRIIFSMRVRCVFVVLLPDCAVQLLLIAQHRMSRIFIQIHYLRASAERLDADAIAVAGLDVVSSAVQCRRKVTSLQTAPEVSLSSGT
jgi:hypothetical protein